MAMQVDTLALAFMVQAQQVLAYIAHAGMWLFPALQFQEFPDGRVAVHPALSRAGGVFEQWQALDAEGVTRLLGLPSDELNGLSPIEWLERGLPEATLMRYVDRIEKDRYAAATDPGQRASRPIALSPPTAAAFAKDGLAYRAQALGPDDGGQWLVETPTSWHVLDLDARRYARLPGAELGESLNLLCLTSPLSTFHTLRVGHSAVLWVGDATPLEAMRWILLPHILTICSVYPDHVLACRS